MRAKIIIGVGVLAGMAIVGYQVASCEVANMELREELRDIAAQNAPRIGLTGPNSDAEIRDSVVRSALSHGIVLDAQQVTVQRSGTAEAPVIYLSVDYRARANLLGYSLILHFTPTSER